MIQAELQQAVLFDEDYRTHIEKLEGKLERERREVLNLREVVSELRCQVEKLKRQNGYKRN